MACSGSCSGAICTRTRARFASGREADGKPLLVDGGISFNLSHSGGLALYAFTSSAAVGLDVERAGRHLDVLAIASRAFGAAEARRLEELDDDARERAFLRAWVRHEAELKCLGVGIGGMRTSDRERPRPWIAELELGPRAAGAVAVQAPDAVLRCWEWHARPATRPPRPRGSSPRSSA